MANEVATQNKDFSIVLMGKLNSVSEALPRDFNKARFVQNTLSLLNDNPDLAKYGQAQIVGGLLKGAYLGLDFYAHECYLIPYGKSLNYQTDYRGEKKLVKKYSIRPIKDITAEIVREGDDFSVGIKDNVRVVNFTPKPFNTGKIVGAFALVEYADGGIGVDTMSVAELENTRRHSKASNSPAWRDFTSEMYRKTVLRRLCKHIEIDFENPTQRSTYEDEVAIETDSAELAKKEIDENANSEDLIIEGEDVTIEDAEFE